MSAGCGAGMTADSVSWPTSVAAYLAARGAQTVLNAVGAHLRCTEPRLSAVEVFADVPAFLAAGNSAPWPGRPRRRGTAPQAAAARVLDLTGAGTRLPQRAGGRGQVTAGTSRAT